MRTITYSTYLLVLIMISAGQLKADIDVGISQANLGGNPSNLMITFSPNSSYAAPFNSWNAFALTISWDQSLGANVLGALTQQHGCGFTFVFDATPAQLIGGVYYKKVTISGAGQVCSFSAGIPVNMFSIVVMHATIASGNFSITAAPPAGVVGGELGLDNLLGNQMSGVVSPATAMSVPLPITLVRFEVKPENDVDARLSWTTASEKGSSHFEIERLNSTGWIRLGAIPAAGNSDILTEYAYRDNAVAAAIQPEKTAYYRLKMVDLNGAYEYSEIRSVIFESNTDEIDYQIFPNPVSGNEGLYIASSKTVQECQIQIVDLSGRVVVQHNDIRLSKIPQHLALHELAGEAGLYLCRIYVNGTAVFRKKVVLQSQ